MGCLKFLFKFITIILVGIVVFFSLIFILFTFVLNGGNNLNSEISEELFNDSQAIVTIINEEFITFDLYETVDETAVETIARDLQDYADKYNNRQLNSHEDALFNDIGIIVQDYISLISLSLSVQDVQLTFNEMNWSYSGTARDYYESFLHHRSYLKETYGFYYEQ